MGQQEVYQDGKEGRMRRVTKDTDKADVLLALSSPTVLDHNCSKLREAKGGSS